MHWSVLPDGTILFEHIENDLHETDIKSELGLSQHASITLTVLTTSTLLVQVKKNSILKQQSEKKRILFQISLLKKQLKDIEEKEKDKRISLNEKTTSFVNMQKSQEKENNMALELNRLTISSSLTKKKNEVRSNITSSSHSTCYMKSFPSLPLHSLASNDTTVSTIPTLCAGYEYTVLDFWSTTWYNNTYIYLYLYLTANFVVSIVQHPLTNFNIERHVHRLLFNSL